MKKEKVKMAVEKKMDAIAKLSACIGTDFDPDVIHKFRVSVKRIRSFLRMYSMYSGKNEPSLPRKLIRLYHTAGNIRELQLEIKKCKGKRSLPVGYNHMLRMKLANQKQKWNEQYGANVFSKAGRRIRKYHYERLPALALDKFVHERLESIVVLNATSGLTDDDIHTIRKYLKDITYNIEWAAKNWQSAYNLLENLPIADLNTLATTIGDYNDERLMWAHLASFVAREPDTKVTSSGSMLHAAGKLEVKKKKVLVNIAKVLSAI